MNDVTGFLRLDEAADVLRVCRSTLRTMIKRGDLPAVRVGKRGVRVPAQALRRLAATQPSSLRGVGCSRSIGCGHGARPRRAAPRGQATSGELPAQRARHRQQTPTPSKGLRRRVCERSVRF
jgi:excisionase family DNA binding protein